MLVFASFEGASALNGWRRFFPRASIEELKAEKI